MSTLKELAKSLKNGMFADRDTIGEAMEYALNVAKGCGGNSAAVLTAVQVVVNTIAKEIEKADRTDELVSAIKGLLEVFAESDGMTSYEDMATVIQARGELARCMGVDLVAVASVAQRYHVRFEELSKCNERGELSDETFVSEWDELEVKACEDLQRLGIDTDEAYNDFVTWLETLYPFHVPGADIPIPKK